MLLNETGKKGISTKMINYIERKEKEERKHVTKDLVEIDIHIHIYIYIYEK